MQEIKCCFDKIKEKLKSGKKLLLMLDFDGTISPIVPTPELAYLPAETRAYLKKINKFFPVIIISGRSLDVVRKKVGVEDFVYAGSHGLEWLIGEKIKCKKVSKHIIKDLEKIEEDFKILAFKYPKLIIEKKLFSVALHYRFVSTQKLSNFKKDLKSLLKNVSENHNLKLFWDKKTVDIVPQLNWNKGSVVNLIQKHFKKKFKKEIFSIYIGDSKTDEDAFRVIGEKGITIRVGKSNKSSAQYYLKNQEQVVKFLNWMVKNVAEDEIHR